MSEDDYQRRSQRFLADNESRHSTLKRKLSWDSLLFLSNWYLSKMWKHRKSKLKRGSISRPHAVLQGLGTLYK
ncbi:hypothetical protein L484_022444 [Morus notabilis]|uniref:Uncharacterized protein n=1 Tax=Morus notabilis TaxID=981085 RepID=W9QS31_9ROSA|nr:hypothetical protein L484_022444 [Morus notabilis]